jgi:predicted nucleic acid-binding protein
MGLRCESVFGGMTNSFSREAFYILRGNAVEVLKQPQNKVDCVVTSPPYYQQRNYGTAGAGVMNAADKSPLFLSVLTLGEILKGVAGLPQSRRCTLWNPSWNWSYEAASLGGFFRLTTRSPTAGGLVADEAKPKGSSLSAIDGLLAATALQHNLTIVSRNVADFGNTPTPILNLWEA